MYRRSRLRTVVVNEDSEAKDCLSAWLLSYEKKGSQAPPREGADYELTPHKFLNLKLKYLTCSETIFQ